MSRGIPDPARTGEVGYTREARETNADTPWQVWDSWLSGLSGFLRTETPRSRSGGQFALNPGRCVLGQLRGVFQVELMLDLLAIVLDRLDAQMQLLGDFTGLFPLANQLEHFQFTVAEALDRGFLQVGFSTDLLLQHLRAQSLR